MTVHGGGSSTACDTLHEIAAKAVEEGSTEINTIATLLLSTMCSTLIINIDATIGFPAPQCVRKREAVKQYKRPPRMSRTA